MDKEKRYFVDITPVIYGPMGEYINLGKVRYEVGEGLIGDLGPMLGRMKLSPYTPVSIPAVPYPTRITFDVEISWTEVPQPSLPPVVME